MDFINNNRHQKKGVMMRWSRLLFIPVLLGFIGCSNKIEGTIEPSYAIQQCLEDVLSIKYNEIGHTYTTFKMCRIAGLDMNRSIALSYYSQYPDIDYDYAATLVGFKYLLIPWEHDWRNDITGVLHSLHGGDHEAIGDRRKNIEKVLKETLKDPENDPVSGLLLHAYADTFAHTKNRFDTDDEQAYGPWIGHAIPNLCGHSPDNIKYGHNMEKYIGYLDDLFEIIKTDDSDEQEFERLKRAVQDLKCDDTKCPDFHKLYVENTQEGAMLKRFEDCMNKTARQLTRDEIQRVMDMAKSGHSGINSQR